MPPGSQLDTLTQINIEDLTQAWGVSGLRLGRAVLGLLFHPAARQFARQLVAFDDAVGRNGLQEGSKLLLRRYVGEVRAAGLAHLPLEGPLLILANHPGLSDALALFAALPRSDLRLVGLERPFLRALPNVASRIFFLPDDAPGRMAVTRGAASHLRGGGAILTFPAGQLEPDPLVQTGAADALVHWSKSIGVLARLVPQAQIVAAVVCGVVAPEAQRNPLTRLRRRQKDRELSGAALQVLWRPYQKNAVRVAFARPLLASDLLATYGDAAAITRAVVQAARGLMESPPAHWEVVVSSGR